jgi:hypothetical protein
MMDFYVALQRSISSYQCRYPDTSNTYTIGTGIFYLAFPFYLPVYHNHHPPMIYLKHQPAAVASIATSKMSTTSNTREVNFALHISSHRKKRQHRFCEFVSVRTCIHVQRLMRISHLWANIRWHDKGKGQKPLVSHPTILDQSVFVP